MDTCVNGDNDAVFGEWIGAFRENPCVNIRMVIRPYYSTVGVLVSKPRS
jgi:hypothetical protein